MEHTNFPWKIIGPSSGQIRGMDDGGDYAIIFEKQIIADVIHRTGKTTYQPAHANAEFIVRACTVHDELLEACKARIDEWHNDNHNFERTEPRSLKLARAAIAKAEGK